MSRTGLVLAIALSAVGAVAYRAGPPPGHTGAFGEPDCGECHFDAIRDDDAGRVAIRAPDRFEPGHTYTIEVRLRHPRLEVAGFQLTARFLGDDGNAAPGTQAGTLEPADDRSGVEVSDAGVAYASHSAAGAAPQAQGSTSWTLRWTAPEVAGGTDSGSSGAVAFDVAAQVGNDDDSEFGERLYRTRHIVRRADRH